MLDIQMIRDDPERVKRCSIDKGYDVDVDRLLELDKERTELKKKLDLLRRMHKLDTEIYRLNKSLAEDEKILEPIIDELKKEMK